MRSAIKTSVASSCYFISTYQDKDLSCHDRLCIAYKINGGQRTSGTGFSLSPSVFPFSIIPSIFHTCILFVYQKSYITFTTVNTIDHNTSPTLQVPMSTVLWWVIQSYNSKTASNGIQIISDLMKTDTPVHGKKGDSDGITQYDLCSSGRKV